MRVFGLARTVRSRTTALFIIGRTGSDVLGRTGFTSAPLEAPRTRRTISPGVKNVSPLGVLAMKRTRLSVCPALNSKRNGSDLNWTPSALMLLIAAPRSVTCRPSPPFETLEIACTGLMIGKLTDETTKSRPMIESSTIAVHLHFIMASHLHSYMEPSECPVSKVLRSVHATGRWPDCKEGSRASDVRPSPPLRLVSKLNGNLPYASFIRDSDGREVPAIAVEAGPRTPNPRVVVADRAKK